MTQLQRLSILAIAQIPLALSRVGPAHAYFVSSYYIDQGTYYDVNHGCQLNNDLDDDTNSLAFDLGANHTWFGYHETDQAAWPADFTDTCAPQGANGVDDQWGDNAWLSVFSGHGNTNLLAFDYPHDNQCDVVLGSNERLGSMNGAKANTAIYYACCVLKLSGLTSGANDQWLNQAMGFIDLEQDGNDDIKNFYEGTYSQQNIYQWTSDLLDRPYWFTGDNSPIVVSYGADQNSAYTAELYSQIFPGNYENRNTGPTCGQGQPLFWYNYYYIDNNNGGCN